MVESEELAVINFINNSETAKEELKSMIISENSPEFYYELIGKEVKKIKDFKGSADTIFGEDDWEFRINYITFVFEKYQGNPITQLYNMCVSDIAIDVFYQE